VGSGTDALSLILRALGIGAGDEVIVPAYTAAATWMAVAWIGARPVGADVDPATGLIDPVGAGAAIGARTKAIVAVHLFGRLARVGDLRDLAEANGLALVEDAAHAHGVDEGSGPAGSFGRAAAFSFYPTKILGAMGDAGAVVTADGDLAESVRRLRSYGWSSWQGDSPTVGVNSRLDEAQAAILRAKLVRLPAALERLRALGGRYRDTLTGTAGLELAPALPGGGEPPWHQFVVTHRARDSLREELGRRGIGTAVHYDPIPPRLGAFAPARSFPAAGALARRALSLPCDPWLSDAQLDAVCGAVLASLASLARSRK
jgi:dTDP-4-amino-4,6-dideoxygalactose transaminase